MALELPCNTIKKHCKRLNTEHSQATHSQAVLKLVHCSSSKSLHAISTLGTQGEAIHIPELSYILGKFLQFCSCILFSSEAALKRECFVLVLSM